MKFWYYKHHDNDRWYWFAARGGIVQQRGQANGYRTLNDLLAVVSLLVNVSVGDQLVYRAKPVN